MVDKNVESIYIHDIVVSEALMQWGFCREAITANSGETLQIGSVVSFERVDVDEVQTATVTGTETAGTYPITIFDPRDSTYKTTTQLAYNANLAAVQAAIDAVLGGNGRVVASGTPVDDTFVLTYSGDEYSGIDVPLATVDVSALTGVTAFVFAQTTAGSVTTNKLNLVTDARLVDGICLVNHGTLTADAESVCLVRGPAIVRGDQLDINSLSLAIITEELAKLGIIVRSQAETSEFQTT